MDDTRKAEILDALSAGIQELTSSDSWQSWLNFQSRFHTYSFLNTLLIQLQAPAGTTRVAGFNAWRRLDRNVRKGEKGIAILAPIVRRTRVEDEDGEQHVITGGPSAFRMVYVFADVQTDGDDLPEIVHRLEGDDPNGLYTRLLPVAASIGFTVEEDYLDGGSNGDCNHRMCRIRIEARNDPRQQVKTLAHELAHAILHGDGYQGSREVAELEAESVAFIVCSNLQLDSSEYSFGYLAGWAGGGDEAIAGIKSAGANIHRAADHILTQLEGADLGAVDLRLIISG